MTYDRNFSIQRYNSSYLYPLYSNLSVNLSKVTSLLTMIAKTRKLDSQC